jgi:hypothetical protein
MPQQHQNKKKYNKLKQKGGEPKKGLIITTGDASDFDGFMALPLYYKAAQKHNMDVMFIMNFPAYFRFAKTDGEKIDSKEEKDISGLKNGDGKDIAYGLGFDYGHDVFCQANKYRIKNMLTEKYEYLKDIETSIQNHYKNVYDITQLDMDIMSFITYRIVMEIWAWCAGTPSINDKTKTQPELKFCKGGINSINPFPVEKLKNEFYVYGKIIADSFKNDIRLPTTPPLSASILQYFHQVDKNNIVTICNKENNIYIDMNGSMAWYNESIQNTFNTENVKGVFVMGGVLSYSQVNTMGAGPFVNRLSCATMNQLYHAKNTGVFFQKFQDKLHFITNNEINANFTFLPENTNIIYKDKTPYTYDQFESGMAILQLIPNDNKHIVRTLFNAFYEPRTTDRKPFDVISALALVQNMDKTVEYQTKKIDLIYNNTYGITILGSINDLDTGLYYNKTEIGIVEKRIITNGFKPDLKTSYIIKDVNVLYASQQITDDTHTNAYEEHIRLYMESATCPWSFTGESFAWPINSDNIPKKGGGGTKIYILGRSRKIIPKGRYQYIMYNKEHITINAARKLELKRQKSKKKL